MRRPRRVHQKADLGGDDDHGDEKTDAKARHHANQDSRVPRHLAIFRVPEAGCAPNDPNPMVPAQAKFAATAGTHGLEPPLKPATAGARTPQVRGGVDATPTERRKSSGATG